MERSNGPDGQEIGTGPKLDLEAAKGGFENGEVGAAVAGTDALWDWSSPPLLEQLASKTAARIVNGFNLEIAGIRLLVQMEQLTGSILGNREQLQPCHTARP